jgi:hypothetical protein
MYLKVARGNKARNPKKSPAIAGLFHLTHLTIAMLVTRYAAAC